MTTEFSGCGRIGRLALAIALACAALPAFAQWQGRGPVGGEVRHLLADPFVPGRVYAQAFAGVFRSDDAGRHWSALAPVAATRGLAYAFIADADVAGRLYLLSAGGELLRSDNSGDSWSATGYAVPLWSSLLQQPPVLVDVPQSSTELLLSLPDAGLLRSVDAGISFSPLPTPYTSGFSAIAFNPLPGDFLASTWQDLSSSVPGPLIVRAGDGGLGSWSTQTPPGQSQSAADFQFLGGSRVAAVLNGSDIGISDTYGQLWQTRLSLPQGVVRLIRLPHSGALVVMDRNDCMISNDEFLDAMPCAIGPSAPLRQFSALVAADDGGQPRLLANDADAGVHATAIGDAWRPSNDGLQGIMARSLALHPADSRVLYAGMWAIDGTATQPQFRRSSDRGAHWSGSLAGLSQYVRYIAIDATTAADPAATHLYASGFSLSSASPRNSGIYKSVDGGASWVSLDQGLPPYANGPGVVMRASRKVLPDPRSCASPPPAGPCTQGPLQTVYALSASGTDARWSVLRSSDAGANWIGVGSALPAYLSDGDGYETVTTVDLELDSAGSVLYVSTSAYWESNDSAVARIPSIRNGVFRSDDGGASWTPRSSGLPLVPGSATTHQSVVALATHPRRSGVLWASAALDDESSRIYTSADGGASWTGGDERLIGCHVLDLQVDTAAPDVIYAAGRGVGNDGGCLWRSEDGGAHWISLGAQLVSGDINALRQDPQDRRRLLIATDRGVWEALLPSDRIFSDSQG